MERSFDASFHPWPAAVDKNARFADYDNDTTAEAKTSTGRTIKFTFCLEPPPAVSHLFVHETDTHHSVQAEVVSSAKDLVLLGQKRKIDGLLERGEYFVYKAAAAGRGRSKPSLTPIPCIPTKLFTLSPCATILPFDDDQFLLADLTLDYRERQYRLHVFSSKTCVWSTTLPLGTCPDDVLGEPEKVIALGGSVLGWVVARAGIIVCDVFGQDPAGARFIPLPKPDSKYSRKWDGSGLHFRDVACCGDGFIRFVDMDLRFRYVTVDSREHTRRVTKMTKDLDYADAILDSELLLPKGVWPATVCAPDGWKIRICYRHISWNYWRKGHVVDSDDIAVYNPRHCNMLPELWDEDVGRWTLKKLSVNQPTLSIHDGNMVYLRMASREGHRDKQGWIVGVDLAKKTVEMLEPFHNSDVQPFTFSQHLNTPPSVGEIIHATNGAQNNHLPWGCFTQNNQPLQQNIWNADGYGNNQHPPPWSANLPHPIHHNLNALGSGCVYPVNALPMYPLHMVNPATHGEQFHLIPFLPPRSPPVSAPSSSLPCRPEQMAFRR